MRSQVQGENKESSSKVSMTRTSKTGWLQDSFHPVIAKLTERVGQVTGLKTDTFKDEAELLQVLCAASMVIIFPMNHVLSFKGGELH